MNSKERVLMAINYAEPDRVPVDFWAEPEMLGKLLDRFGGLPEGYRAQSDAVRHSAAIAKAMYQAYERLLLHVGSDIREVHPEYTGPPPREFDDGTRESVFGCRVRPVQTRYGVYHHALVFPLENAGSVQEVLDSDCWPDPDLYDYQGVVDRCAYYGNYATMSGSFSIWNFTFFTRGTEQILLDLGESPPDIADAIIEKHSEFCMAYYERLLNAAKGRIDIIRTYDDYGTQRGLMMSPRIWCKLVKPRLAALVELVHSYDTKFMLHSCGSVAEVIPDIIETGVDILDPIQTKAAGMAPEELQAQFGGQICFHGGLDTQDVLPHGSTEDVAEEVKHLLRVFAPAGGYIFNSSQALMPDTPVENVEAMYQAARRWGNYPIVC